MKEMTKIKIIVIREQATLEPKPVGARDLLTGFLWV